MQFNGSAGVWGRCLLISLLAAGCTFSLDEKFVKPVDPPASTITVYLDLEDPDQPIYVFQNTSFRLRVEAERELTEYTVQVGGIGVQPVTFSQGMLQFDLSPSNFPSGTQTLEINLFFTSGTGSMAEALGQEVYWVTQTYQVIIDGQLPTLSSPLQASLNSGYMRLSWNVSKPYPFLYKIGKYRIVSGVEQLVGTSFVTAVNPVQFVDSGFVGGHYRYVASVESNAGSITLGSVVTRKSPAAFAVQQSPDQFYSLQYAPAIANASVTLLRSGGSTEHAFDGVTLGLDTLYLGDQRTFRLVVRRNKFPAQAYDTTFTAVRSPVLPAFSDAVVLPGASKLVLLINGDPRRYNATTFSLEDKLSNYLPFIDVPFIVSNHAGYFLTRGLYVNGNDFTLRTTYRNYISTPQGGFRELFANAASSASSTGLAGLQLTVNGLPSAAVTDLTIPILPVATMPTVTYLDSLSQDIPSLSHDGNFMAVNAAGSSYAQVYRLVAGNWVKHGRVPPHAKYFRGNGTNELIVIGPNIMVFDVSVSPGADAPFTAVRTFALPAVPAGETRIWMGYDLPSQYVYMESLKDNYSTIRTYSVDNLSIQERAVAYVPPVFPVVRHLYQNHTHLLSSGHFEPLQP